MAFPEYLADYIQREGVSVAGALFDLEPVSDEITDQGRWETYHLAVVEHDGRFWAVEYATGSTEYQDDDGEYTVYEVEPVEKTVTVYARK